MNAIELLDIISTGETSKVQFKEKMPHPDSIAQEIAAINNNSKSLFQDQKRDTKYVIIDFITRSRSKVVS